MTHIDDSPRNDPRAVLSVLWIFVLMNVVFRDIHELFRPGLLDQMISGTVNGVEMTDQLLLAAGIGLEIPLLMMVLARIVKPGANRWINIAAAPVSAVLLISAGINDLDDVFFISVEVLGLIAIVWYAWSWRV